MDSVTFEESNKQPITVANVEDEVEGLDMSLDIDQWNNYPLDTVLIRSEQRTVVDTVRRINQKRFIMDPDFQRDFIWDPVKQSRLIESTLMRIPLPVFYLAELHDGRNVVVDGLQRLTTFQHFLGNNFLLKNLENHDLNGKRFSDLNAKHQNRIEDTNLILYLIDPKVPEQVKLDIFERVNGGVPLTRQQMRNCIHVGPATLWLKEEAATQEFLIATGGSLNPKPMRDREVINRFCGFQVLGLSAYQGDMDKFLADTLNKMNKLTKSDLDDLSASFRRSMKNNYLVFGQHAFRRHLNAEDRRSVINVALFDVFSTLLANYTLDIVDQQASAIRAGFYRLMQQDEMKAAITLGTNQVNRVASRFQLVEQMLKEAVDHA
jgi:hypothetical protein